MTDSAQSDGRSPDGPISVSAAVRVLDQQIRKAFDGEPVWVRGTLSGMGRERPPSGFRYFNLVESGQQSSGRSPIARLSVVLFPKDRERLNRRLSRIGASDAIEDDAEVVLLGRFEVYAPTGSMQFKALDIDTTALRAKRFTEREESLQAIKDDGLLNLNRSLPVPSMPLRIGLVTSSSGAVIQDVKRVLNESPYAFTVLFGDATVQGSNAPQSIMSALARVSAMRPDLVMICRGGGGSIDLRAFDALSLARSVARAPVPVFAGIGHEIDMSLLDMVAHSSFSTPTAAAQGVVSLLRDCETSIGKTSAALAQAAAARLNDARQHQRHTSETFEMAARMHSRTLNDGLRSIRGELESALKSRVASSAARIGWLHETLGKETRRCLSNARSEISAIHGMLAALDPAVRLRQGWSITTTPDGRPVTSYADAAADEVLITRVADGIIASRVTHTAPDQPHEVPT